MKLIDALTEKFTVLCLIGKAKTTCFMAQKDGSIKRYDTVHGSYCKVDCITPEGEILFKKMCDYKFSPSVKIEDIDSYSGLYVIPHFDEYGRIFKFTVLDE